MIRKRKLKILVITSLFPNKKQKNKGIFVLNRILPLKKYFDIEVIAPIPWFPIVKKSRPRNVPTKEYIKGIKVYHPISISIPKFFKILDGYFFYLSLKKFKDKIKKADILDAHFAWPDGYGSFLAAKKHNKKLSVTLRGRDMTYWYKKRKIRCRIKKMLKNSELIVSVSNRLKQIAGCENIKVIPNGVDTKIFRPLRKDLSRKIIGISKEKKVFLTVGCDFKRKGYFELVESFKKIKRKNKILIIIGSDKKENKKLKQKIDKSGLSKEVILTGSVDNKKLPYFYSAADVYCLVSHSEGWPNSVMEALACGKPCIATEESAGEFITKDLGIITDYKNLTKNMEKALKKKWNPKKIRKFAEKNTWNKTAQKLSEFYKKIK